MSESTAVSAPLCGAKTRKPGNPPCENRAGFKTDHFGQGRCWLHGGLTPIKHGMESSIQHPRIAELQQRFLDEPDPLGLWKELALLRALYTDFIDRHEAFAEALLAWHAHHRLLRKPLPPALVERFAGQMEKWEALRKAAGEWTGADEEAAGHARQLLALMRGESPMAPPRVVMDIADAGRLIAETGKMVERIERMRAANAISEAELNRIINQMSRVVDVVITDPTAKEKIRDGWLAIVTR